MQGKKNEPTSHPPNSDLLSARLPKAAFSAGTSRERHAARAAGKTDARILYE